MVGGLTARGARMLIALLAAGFALRIWLAFATRGQAFDITSYEVARDALRSDPLHLYALANDIRPHWPYPGGFLPWVVISGWVSDGLGWRFDGVLQLAPIIADVLLAFIVLVYLDWRGAGERTKLASAAVILLAPGFWVISGYHGQIDAVACVPALLALIVWQREGERRALTAGVLMGIAVAVKQPPVIMVLALLPTARSFREAMLLLVAMGLLIVLSVAPFLIADLPGTVDGLTANKGLPGLGGISLLLQPDLSALWLHTKDVSLSALSEAVFDHGAFFVGLTMLGITGVLIRWRVPALEAAIIVWLGFYVLGINFGITYLIYGVPLLLMAGRLRGALVLQTLLIVPIGLLYIPQGRSLPLELIYTPVMLVVWGMIGAWLWSAIRLERRRTGLRRIAAPSGAPPS